MRLIYFDETKFSKDNPYFFIGGILLKQKYVPNLESELMQLQQDFFGVNSLDRKTELHGQHIYQGIGSYKSRTMTDRIALFQKIGELLIQYKIPIRVESIDVKANKQKYIYPEPPYWLGLMLLLEQFYDFLNLENDIGIAFGDYEKDKITQSIHDFSEYKKQGTPMYYGRSIKRLIDTIYFTHSHHSRFLQVADMVMYMVNRYRTEDYKPQKWQDIELHKIWKNIKEKTDFGIKRWPR